MREPLTLSIDQIKRSVVKAILSDDTLFENLVLKGGNAIDLIHQIAARASVDIDFSMPGDFPGGADELRRRVDSVLTRTFSMDGYRVFDLKMLEKPEHLSEGMAAFWGGYSVEFKLISEPLYKQHGPDIDVMRKYALNLGQGKKFLIDINRHEYVDHKQSMEFEGYIIYVYSPEMIVCEKLRAICQQMPEYGPVIRRGRPGSARARDFVDIYYLVTMLNLNVTSDEYRTVIAEMFARKRVPLSLLGRVRHYREFHRADFAAVQATMSPNFVLKDFDTYFEFTLDLVAQLHSLWDV